MTNESDILKRNPVSYSIWLMPKGNVKYQLKKIIYMLSTEFDGPIFTPHVTLVSSFLGSQEELSHKTRIISKKIKPFEEFELMDESKYSEKSNKHKTYNKPKI